MEGRNKCDTDEECLENGRKFCDADPGCFGIGWYSNSKESWWLNQRLKMCTSTKMAYKTDGWRTFMKLRMFNIYR